MYISIFSRLIHYKNHKNCIKLYWKNQIQEKKRVDWSSVMFSIMSVRISADRLLFHILYKHVGLLPNLVQALSVYSVSKNGKSILHIFD